MAFKLKKFNKILRLILHKILKIKNKNTTKIAKIKKTDIKLIKNRKKEFIIK